MFIYSDSAGPPTCSKTSGSSGKDKTAQRSELSRASRHQMGIFFGMLGALTIWAMN